MIRVGIFVAILLWGVDAQLQAQSCSISCPGDPTLPTLPTDTQRGVQAGRQGKRGVNGLPGLRGPPGAPGGKGPKGEQGEGIDIKSFESEIEALRNSITQLKRLALVGGWSGASNDRWYRVFRTPKTFDEARALCKTYGASLAHAGMKNLSLIREVIPLVGISDLEAVWIGATDITQEGTWVWEDGSRDPVVNWSPGEPSNGQDGEHCLMISGTTRINDSACGSKKIVLCETERM